MQGWDWECGSEGVVVVGGLVLKCDGRRRKRGGLLRTACELAADAAQNTNSVDDSVKALLF